MLRVPGPIFRFLFGVPHQTRWLAQAVEKNHPPEALAVQALEDPRLIAAHHAAVAETAAEIEDLAGARVRKLGANDTRVTSNLVLACYDHDTSRDAPAPEGIALLSGAEPVFGSIRYQSLGS
jgi:hypothetical protein